MANIRRSTRSMFAQLFIVLLITQTFISSYNESNVVEAYKSGMNPGMQLRLEQKTIDSFKRSMEYFLPHYINVDMKMPTEYHYTFELFFSLMVWDVHWTKITYTQADLDIADVQIQLTRNFDKSLLTVKFPAVKHWEIDAHQDVNFWFLPDISDVQLIFKDFKIDFQTDLQLDENGYLDPVVYDADIHFGESYLYHDNPIVAFFMHQFIYFGIVIIENSVYFVGQYIFTNMMGPVMDSFLNHYKLPFSLPTLVRGQDSIDNFELDYRNTQSPFIGEGWVDIFFSGELMYNGEGCNIEPKYMDFMQSQTFSQLVVSESAATCWANQVAKSNLGKIFLNSKSTAALWGEPGLTLDSTKLNEHLPIFYEKIGANKTLKADISFKDFNVMFGKYDSDVILEYTFCFSMRQNLLGAPELIYDEIRMVTSAKLRMEDDIIFIDLLKNHMNIDNKYGQRDAPMRDGMKLTPNEYKEFISTFGFFTNYMKQWLNNVYFKNGLQMPFNPKEIYTTLAFKEESMHIMLEVEEEADKFFEDELWDDEAKKQLNRDG